METELSIQGKLKTPKDIQDTLQRTIDDLLQKVLYIVSRLMQLRVIVTVLLVGWLLVISHLLVRADKEGREDDRNRYFSLHRVWFGDSSVVQTLFNMWYYTILLLLVSPLVGWLAKVTQLYFASQVIIG